MTEISQQLSKILKGKENNYSISVDAETFCSTGTLSPLRLSRLGRLQAFISTASNSWNQLLTENNKTIVYTMELGKQ